MDSQLNCTFLFEIITEIIGNNVSAMLYKLKD